MSISRPRPFLLASLLLAACAGDLGGPEDLDALEPTAGKADGYEDLDLKEVETVEVTMTPAELRPALDEKGNPVPGTLVIDGAKGAVDLTALTPLERPREFGSLDELAKFAAETLNAELVEDEEGHLGARLAVDAPQTFFYDPETDSMRAASSPVSAILGGRFGYVVVAGEQRCVDREAPCFAEESAEVAGPPGSDAKDEKTARFFQNTSRVVGQHGFAIRGNAWITHLIAVHSLGSSTEQLNTGVGVTWSPYRCGPFGWFWCYQTVGQNHLSTSFTAYRFYGNHWNGYATASRANTWWVRAEHWGFGIVIKSSPIGSDPSLGVGYAGIVAETDTVCANHSGSTSWISVFTTTMLGYRC